MRWIAALVVALTAVATADAPPPQAPVHRKPASDQYPIEALTSFVEAIVADKAGDLTTAVDRYRRSLRASDQASTHYNLANVQHRMEYYPQAVASYRRYLELAPDAPDRKEVERVIDEIEHRPSIAVIDGDDGGAVVLVDGKLVGPSPALVYPAKGPHLAERIGPASYARRPFLTHDAHTEHVQMRHRQADGNVVLSASRDLRSAGKWEDQGHRFELPGRFALPPGRYRTYLVRPDRACQPLTFEVTKGDHITYVYVDEQPDAAAGRCTAITVRTQKIRLPR